MANVRSSQSPVNVYFSDYFGLPPEAIDSYGALDISLNADLPMFIDPFLLFSSRKSAYRKLHDRIIEYVRFLRDESLRGRIRDGDLRAWFEFKEIKETWLGFSLRGNLGSGLGPRFAQALHGALTSTLRDFDDQEITSGQHLEKLTLITEGVGNDNISDFTTNLILQFLCEFTQEFSQRNLRSNQTAKVAVPHVHFDYGLKVWLPQTFVLPIHRGRHVLLTPKDILRKDEIWINKQGLLGRFTDIVASIDNDELRDRINDYFASQLSLPVDATQAETTKAEREAKRKTINEFPLLVDHYIRERESRASEAHSLSESDVRATQQDLIDRVRFNLVPALLSYGFYEPTGDTLAETRQRVQALKHFIEQGEGYKNLYDSSGSPMKQEYRVQLLFKLAWYGTVSSVDREVNNGLGPVDYKISRGASDSTLVEFKLASNTKLKHGLEKQVEIYKSANRTNNRVVVVVYFFASELVRVQNILSTLELSGDQDIVLIDARSDNKRSASKA